MKNKKITLAALYRDWRLESGMPDRSLQKPKLTENETQARRMTVGKERKRQRWMLVSLLLL
jgi:hypothetical protein